MDSIDRELLNILQYSFPLTTTPWATISETLSIPEVDVIKRITKLKSSGVIRQISPIFDSKKIGYHSTLAAFEVPEERVNEVASKISEHKGVSHNYLRSHKTNLWFTLTLSQESSLELEIKRIATELKIEKWFYLPSLMTYKIGFRLNMQGDSKSVNTTNKSNVTNDYTPPYNSAFIAHIQHDFPLIHRPYQEIAKTLTMSEENIVELLEQYLSCGYLRRIAAVLTPVKAGFKHNVMVGWETKSESDSDRLGTFAATLEGVSHSYKRKLSDGWPVSVYTMLHGETEEQIENIIMKISEKELSAKYHILKTVREFKKERVLYHTDSI